MSGSSHARHPVHTFDIDKYLNRFVPRSRLDVLPRSISYWFGYRAPPKDKEAKVKSSDAPTSVLLVWFFSFLGAFIGIAIIENVFLALPRLDGHPVPIVIASFGAAAILEYNTIESPLAQPRNLVFGHFLSAVIGVGITKLFRLLPEARFEDLRWLAGALSVGVASSVMGMTKTIHPPAGATALLAATTPEMTLLGWWLLPLVLLACALMLASAMLVNNVYKRFPLYWWTPVDLSKPRKAEVVRPSDVEKGEQKQSSDMDSNIESSQTSLKKQSLADAQIVSARHGSDTAYASHSEGEVFDSVQKKKERNIHDETESRIGIDEERIIVPDWMSLSQWEVEVLEGFQVRLRQAGNR